MSATFNQKLSTPFYWLLSLSLVTALNACADTPDADFTPRPKPYSQVATSQFCGDRGREASIQYLQDVRQRQWLSQRLSLNVEPGSQPWIVVNHGTRPTGGYGFVVSQYKPQSNRGAGSTIDVAALFMKPIAGAFRSQVITHPCVILAVTPPQDLRLIRLFDDGGKERARLKIGDAGAAATMPSTTINY